MDDYTYRELQAEHQFQWGTFSPNMELQLLVPKRPRQSANIAAQPYLPSEGCKLFKARGSCPFGNSCKYRHMKAKTPNEQVSEPKEPKKHETGRSIALNYEAWEHRNTSIVNSYSQE